MRDAIRCCISCILPCGALDVIRIVHINGHVEAIGGTVKAGEIMKLHPKHVLKKPSEERSENAVVSPDAELERGEIYFLMPLPPAPEGRRSPAKRKRRRFGSVNRPAGDVSVANLLVSDRCLSEVLSEKMSPDRQRGRRVGVWRPRLESISETPAET